MNLRLSEKLDHTQSLDSLTGGRFLQDDINILDIKCKSAIYPQAISFYERL